MSNAVTGFRLSTQQERLYSQQEGDFPFWAEVGLQLEGILDAAKLREAVSAVVTRHEILRTVFHRQTGLKLPFQIIQESAEFGWQFVDLSDLEESLQGERVWELVSSHRIGFDLERGPVLHVVLATLAPQKHFLTLSLPALCSDLRGLQNLVNEIGLTYAGGLHATDDVMQYADVAEWQQELLTSEDTKAGRDFWRDYCRKVDFAALESVLSAFEGRSLAQFSPDVVTKQIELAAECPAIEHIVAGLFAGMLAGLSVENDGPSQRHGRLPIRW